MKSILYGRSGKWVRRALWFLLDLCFVFLAAYAALLLRFDGAVNRQQLGRILSALPYILLVYAACGIFSGLYEMIWRFASGPEFLRLATAYAAAGLITLLLSKLCNWGISRPVLVMTAMITLILVVASRLTWKWLREALSGGGRQRQTRILIVGAGEGGAYAVRICQQNRANFGTPVAFVDDDPLKRHMRVSGIPVCGTIADIPEIVKQKSVDEIIVAVPGTHGERLTEIVSLCKSTRCRTRMLSDPNDVDRAGKATAFRELNAARSCASGRKSCWSSTSMKTAPTGWSASCARSTAGTARWRCWWAPFATSAAWTRCSRPGIPRWCSTPPPTSMCR